MLLKFSTVVVIEIVRSGSGVKLLREEVLQKSKAPEVIKNSTRREIHLVQCYLFWFYAVLLHLLTTKKQEAVYQGQEQEHFYFSEILVFCSVVENKPGRIICSRLIQAP